MHVADSLVKKKRLLSHHHHLLYFGDRFVRQVQPQYCSTRALAVSLYGDDNIYVAAVS
jgi:nicotinic acid phosphoribosyltransferase